MANGTNKGRRAILHWAILALCLFIGRSARAISITAGPTPSNTSITSESAVSASSGITVNFSLDVAGDVELDIYQVSPEDSSLTQVAAVFKTFSGAGTQSIFWNGLWLIGTEFARRNGTFAYQLVPSAGGSPGTALPPIRDPSSFFTIDSVDIHNVTVTPSLDAAQQPTFPYVVSYNLAKTSLVTATIVNSSNVLVRTFASQRQAGESVSTASITWDGVADDGQPAAIDNYTITINATDPVTHETAIPRTATIDVLSLAGASTNPQKLFEDNVYVFPNPVRSGLGTFRMQAIREGASLSLKIYTMTGDLVFEQDFPGVASGNIVTFPWNAVNQSGRKVGRGLYYYVVREEDSAGTLQTVKKMAVLP